MRKSALLYLLVLIGLVLLVRAGFFAYQNLRGVGPVFRPPVSDITKQLSESVNTTGFPLSIPKGFSVSIFAKGLGGPRVLAWDTVETLLVSIPSRGTVVALPDVDGDGMSDATKIITQGLNAPHGLAFLQEKLYIAETNQVASYDYDAKNFTVTQKRKIIDLPSGGNHVTRTIGFGPDGRLYISVGSSCNVCIERDWRRAKILVANSDGSDLQEYASGLRNSVFFTWDSVTQQLWATDMGRDLIGDDIPPDEINIITDDANYGWPYCYGDNVHDTTFDNAPKAKEHCATSIPSHIDLQAHSAPLGLAFIPESWPTEYRGDLLVSYHGSWNRTEPTGYKVVRFDLDEQGNSIGESDFLTGFLDGKTAFGRPVDLLFDVQGNLFVSDDKKGMVYLIQIK